MNRNYLLIGLAVAVAGFIFLDSRKIKRRTIPPVNNTGPTLVGGTATGVTGTSPVAAGLASGDLSDIPPATGGTGTGTVATGIPAGGWNPASSNAAIT